MKKSLFIAFIVFAFQGISAQNLSVLNLQDFYKKFKTSQFEQGLVNQTSEIEGSPHEIGNFIDGEVITKSDLKYINVPLRFNIYANEIEFKTEDGTIFFLASPEIIDHIIIGENKYIYAPYTVGSRLLRGYFKILIEGKANLLVKQNITLRNAEPPQPYKDAQPAMFLKMQDEFFVRIAPAEAFKVSNKKELLSVLADKGKELDDFQKKNKTKFNRLDDMVKLIGFYNSLQ
jgi:hypothetical protein